MSDQTRLNPAETALLVIDVQKGIFSRPTPVYGEEELLNNINSLIELFSRSDAKTYFIQHSNQKFLQYGSVNWEFHPALQISENDLIIHKTHGNAFEDTILQEELDSRGIRTIVITGLVTNGCVRATSIAGNELGYRVILVEDGHSSYIRGAEKLIREWNRKLSADTVDLCSASEIVLK